MNGYNPDRGGGDGWTPDRAASNIRRYLHAHQGGSRSTTLVVAQLAIEKSEHEGDEQRENGSKKTAPRVGGEDRPRELARSPV